MKKMENKKNLDEIVLYHGSLAELNSRDPNMQYRFADELSFTSDYHDNYHSIRKELLDKGYDGIVNRKTRGLYVFIFNLFKVEGTPIIKIDKGKSIKES